MPAAVETAVYANEPAWHRLGTVVDTEGDKGLSVEQALELSGLDWAIQKAPTLGFSLKANRALQKLAQKDEVSLYEAFMQKVRSGAPLKYSDLVWVQDRFNTQRQSDGQVMGVVGKTWEPVQNVDGFQIINDVIEQAGGVCWIEAAGALDGGKKVWVLAHVDSQLQIAGERYFSYILFYNGHDGRASVTAAMTDVRAVCQNTVDWALSQATKDERVVRVRHTTKASERIQEAHHLLGLRNQRAEQLAQVGEFMADSSMDEGAFNEFLQTLMPVPEGQEGKPAETMIKDRRNKVHEIYMQAPNLKPIRGTVWGALQSVVEYSDHYRRFDSEETQLKAQFSITNQDLKQSAYELALSFASAV